MGAWPDRAEAGPGHRYHSSMPVSIGSRSRLAACITAFALLAAACGGDDADEAEADPTATAVAEATAAPTATPQPEPVDDDPADARADAGTDSDEPGTDDAPPSSGSALPTPTQGPISGDPAFTAASKLTTLGLDELFFGDPVDFAAEVADTVWTGLPDENSRPQCYTVQPQGGPAGIHFTVMDGSIERVDITNPIITTRSGAGVGFSEAALTELFGDSLEIENVAGGKQVTFVPTEGADRAFRIIWVTDGNAVVSMRAGRTTLVTPSSPCG